MQLVATWCIQRFGAKLVSTVENVGISLSLLLAPTAMRAGGPIGLALCFTSVGVFQAPLFPAISVMKRAWTAGVEPAKRAMLLRIMSVGGHFGAVGTAFAVPRLASRYGWRAVPYVYGGLMGCLALTWHFWASDDVPPSNLLADRKTSATTLTSNASTTVAARPSLVSCAVRPARR